MHSTAEFRGLQWIGPCNVGPEDAFTRPFVFKAPPLNLLQKPASLASTMDQVGKV